MVNPDEYPQFPKLECSTCKEKFEVPRVWVNLPGYGNQILLDWEASEVLMKYHFQTHVDDLIKGAEGYLALQGS